MGKVYVCIASRDGRVQDEVLKASTAACRYANERGVLGDFGLTKDAYSASACRNRAVAEFLARDGYDRLMFIDDDVVVPADAVHRLYLMSLKPGKDVVFGCYPTIRFPMFDQPPYPYVAVLTIGGDWKDGWFDGEEEVAGAGAGCMMIGRHVLEAVGHPWFSWPETYHPESGSVTCQSDDIAFCNRARNNGFKLWADGEVRCGHLKTVDVATMIGHESEARRHNSWRRPLTVEQRASSRRTASAF